MAMPMERRGNAWRPEMRGVSQERTSEAEVHPEGNEGHPPSLRAGSQRAVTWAVGWFLGPAEAGESVRASGTAECVKLAAAPATATEQQD